jgi:hypothetical protein
MRYWTILVALFWFCPAHAEEQDHAQVQDCSRAFLKAKTKINSDIVSSLAMALTLLEESWNEVQKEPHFGGSILGIPAGDHYEEFQQNIQDMAKQYGLQNFARRSFATATIGLNQESFEAYKTCLWSKEEELELVARTLDSDNYQLKIFYRPKKLGAALKAEIISIGNMTAESADALRQLIKNAKFGIEPVDQEFNFVPEDSKRETVVNIKIGDNSLRGITFPPTYHYPKITDCTLQINDKCFRCGIDFDKKNVGGNPPNGPDDIIHEYCTNMPAASLVMSELNFTLIKQGGEGCWFSAFLNGADGKRDSIWTQLNKCSYPVTGYTTRAVHPTSPGIGDAELHIARCSNSEGNTKDCEVKGHIDIFVPVEEP